VTLVYPENDPENDVEEFLTENPEGKTSEGCICGWIVPGDDGNLECQVHLMERWRELMRQNKD